MPLFNVLALDKANALDLRLATREAHLSWVRSFTDQIAAGGPLLSDDGETMIGSMFIIAFDSLADAKAWAAEDPYAKAGLFERVEIRPFKWSIGTGPTGE